ncbi:UNVERIFIED_ORG: hypothetical protein J2Y81_000754 [Paraburkholderia sediminicola]|nr:hypothetical protein [Paraburkholderia sediminicola]
MHQIEWFGLTEHGFHIVYASIFAAAFLGNLAYRFVESQVSYIYRVVTDYREALECRELALKGPNKEYFEEYYKENPVNLWDSM